MEREKTNQCFVCSVVALIMNDGVSNAALSKEHHKEIFLLNSKHLENWKPLFVSMQSLDLSVTRTISIKGLAHAHHNQGSAVDPEFCQLLRAHYHRISHDHYSLPYSH